MPEWDLRAPAPELADAYRRAGWWNDDTLGRLVERGTASGACRAGPDLVEDTPVARARWVTCSTSPTRFAGGLRSPGRRALATSSAVQVPNWVEGAATWFASSMLGAVRRPDRALLRHARALVHPRASHTPVSS